MLINEIVTLECGDRYLVRQARSMANAISEISMARVTGSVGSSSTLYSGGVVTVLADIVRLNEDGSEVQPG